MLLDTHCLLWALSGDSRLSESARRHYESDTYLCYSVVSLWEIGIKLGWTRKDFRLEETWWRSIPQTLAAQGIDCLHVEAEDRRDVAKLSLHHRDPFDRMLVVQAMRKDVPILSADPKLDAYPVDRIW